MTLIIYSTAPGVRRYILGVSDNRGNAYISVIYRTIGLQFGGMVCRAQALTFAER